VDGTTVLGLVSLYELISKIFIMRRSPDHVPNSARERISQPQNDVTHGEQLCLFKTGGDV
jgi:hypothetical protein